MRKVRIFFTKIAAILNFHVNIPPSWILWVFGPFLKIYFPPSCASLHIINFDAACSVEETIH